MDKLEKIQPIDWLVFIAQISMVCFMISTGNFVAMLGWFCALAYKFLHVTK